MSVLVVGSVAFDTVKTPLHKHKDILGGSATYASVSASFFSPVNLVAVVGFDFPQKYRRLLARHKINLNGLAVEKGKTFRWEGEYGWDFADPRTICTQLNVFSRFNPTIPKGYRNSRYVFLANIDPLIQEKVLGQIRKPKLVACDTMNYWIAHKCRSLQKILKEVDIFLLNESEARELTQQANLLKAGKRTVALGPKIVIIKKGEHGALLFTNRACFCLPAFLLETVVDPTGAGDSFAGGLIGYLAQCKKLTLGNLKKAIAYGSVMATFAVESFSVKRLFSITRRDITKRLQSFKEQLCL